MIHCRADIYLAVSAGTSQKIEPRSLSCLLNILRPSYVFFLVSNRSKNQQLRDLRYPQVDTSHCVLERRPRPAATFLAPALMKRTTGQAGQYAPVPSASSLAPLTPNTASSHTPASLRESLTNGVATGEIGAGYGPYSVRTCRHTRPLYC